MPASYFRRRRIVRGIPFFIIFIIAQRLIFINPANSTIKITIVTIIVLLCQAECFMGWVILVLLRL